MSSKHILCLQTHSPYGNQNAHEALNILLSLTSFEHHVSVAFIDDGVFHLLQGQEENHGLRTLGTAIKALPIYDVEDIYVDEVALKERHLTPEDLLLPVKLIRANELVELIHDHDHLLSLP